MAGSIQTTRFRLWLWLIALVGVIVPRRLRPDWREEWEAELRSREAMLAEWDRLDWPNKLDLLRRSAGALRDALLLQPRRLEDEMFQDLRYGARMLLRHKGFTIVAVLSLALGIGGNAAIFSLVNRVLIRPLPYAHPDRLVRVTEAYPKGAIAALQEQSRTMEVAAFTADSEFNLTGQGEAARLVGSQVSANLFALLGAPARIGRTFEAGEDRPARDGVVILSHALWRNKFGGDPNIIGRPIAIDGMARQVVGVMPPGFSFPSPGVQLWMPARFDPSQEKEFWNFGWMSLMARLRTGASRPQAQSELNTLNSRIAALFPYPVRADWNAKSTVVLLQEDLTRDLRGKLLLLLAAVACVLLIACANVASLSLAKVAARQTEMAVRTALGAGRGRIVRQLLTESVVLALAGAGLGLVLAAGGLSALKSMLPGDNGLLIAAGIDWQVFAFVTALAVLTGLAFGIAPALGAAKPDLATSLKTRGQQTTGLAGARLRSSLIVGEVALAVALVTGAGLLVKSLWLLTQENPGFRAEQIVTVRVYPQQPASGQGRAGYIALYDELMRRARGITGVGDVAAANTTPLSGELPILPVELEGHLLNVGQQKAPLFWAGAVTPDYFKILRIPLLAGRLLNEADAENSAEVVLVSAATAREYWPGEDPLGKHIRIVWEQRQRTVVGVVGDVRQFDLSGKAPEFINGAFYLPYPQSTDLNRQLPAAMTLILRTAANAPQLAGELRRLVAGVNPDLPVSEVRTLEAAVTDSASPSRSLMWLFVSFGGAALLLAAIGVYGVVSYSTAQRTYEMGVRMAFGATPRRIFGLVLGQSLRLVFAGLTLGVAASLGLTRLMAGYLYGITATDPLTFLSVGLLLMATGLLAGYFPARRAAGVDPMAALRHK
ncbi:MAG TPA: ABC transporter permease [Blastocatellia bacterium]|nr:ABC transporter permease [Blastocatellia bacterium]